MHSFLVILAVLTTNVFAAPTNPLFSRADTCNILPCVTALEPSFPACAPAVTAQGADTPSNTACLTAAAKGTAPFPTACAPCATRFGVTDPASKAKATTAATPNNAQGTVGTTPSNAQGTAGTTANNANGNTAADPVAANNASPVGVGRGLVTRASTCDINACCIALEPSFPACAPAVAQFGADNTFNTACLAAAAMGSSPFPSSCGGCAAQFGVTDPGSNVKTTPAGANHV